MTTNALAPTDAHVAALRRTAFVLVEPSHPGNVGAAARAMKVMGLARLIVVRPRHDDALVHPDAIAFASGATDLLAAARQVDTLEEALAPFTLAVAVSARGREFGPQPTPPEPVAEAVLDELACGAERSTAFVFGTERVGLSIEQVARCQRLVAIPTADEYDSLNLAQAVQVIAYCLRRAALARDAARGVGGAASRASAPASSDAPAGVLADQRSIEGFFAHLERALIVLGYLDPKHPKKLMPRLRRLFARARLEAEEVDLLRGICKLIERRR